MSRRELFHTRADTETHVTRGPDRTIGHLHAASALTVFLVLLLAIPSRYVFAPFGAAGTPAQLFAISAGVGWLAFQWTQCRRGARSTQPLQLAILAFIFAVLASYVVATVRPIGGVELRSADRGLLSVCAWAALFLVTSGGINTGARLDALLRRLVIGGGALATFGILQFLTKKSFTNLLRVPGLAENGDLVSLARGGFFRPAGTAIHSIEFGVVLCMILPFALHYALLDRHRAAFRRWYPVLTIALAIPMSISRSAVVGVAVVLAFLLPTWTRAQRSITYVLAPLLLGVLYVAVPGLLGTLRGLFAGISSDGSTVSRTDSYSLASDYVSRSPFLGRGFGTFLPSYRILDNQYLGTLIEMGVLGLGTLLALFLVGIISARRVRRVSADSASRQLAQSLAASLGAAAVSYAFFDALAFPMVASLTFLLLGAVGALGRLQSRDQGEILADPTLMTRVSGAATGRAR